MFLASDDEPLSTTKLIELIAKELDKNVYLIKIPFFESFLKLAKPSFHKRLYESLEVDNRLTMKTLFGEVKTTVPYTTEEGTEETPICIHRAPLSTHERMIGFLIEHYGGDFPLWLAPVQVAILPVSEKANEYAKEVYNKLFDSEIRVNLDDRPDKIGAKIRQAEIDKINVMIIVGEKEKETDTISVRRRFMGDLGTMKLDELTVQLNEEIKQRRNTNRKED